MIYFDGASYYKISEDRPAKRVSKPLLKNLFSLLAFSKMQAFILKERFDSKDIALSECIKRGAKWNEGLSFLEIKLAQDLTLCIIYEADDEPRLPVFLLPFSVPRKDATMFCIKDSISIYKEGRLLYIGLFGDESDVFTALERADSMNINIEKVYSDRVLESTRSYSMEVFGADWEIKMAGAVARAHPEFMTLRKKRDFVFSTLIVPFFAALFLYYYYLDSKIDTVQKPSKLVNAPAYASLYEEITPVINLAIQEGIVIKKLQVHKKVIPAKGDSGKGRERGDEITIVLANSTKIREFQEKLIDLGFIVRVQGNTIKASR